jgi:signal peptidase I
MVVRLLSRVVSWSIVVGLIVGVAGGVVAWHDGYRAYAIRTGSMTPTYPTGALVIDRPVDGNTPSVGDVITFQTTQDLVTHRVHGISSEGIQTKGDANETADASPTQPQHVVGVVTWGAAYLGYVLVFFQQPTGILSLMLLCLSIWCAWSAFFPAKKPAAEQVVALHDDEPPDPSDEGIAVVPPGERAAAAEGSPVIRLPGELAGAAAGGGVIRLPEQRSRPGLLST